MGSSFSRNRPTPWKDWPSVLRAARERGSGESRSRNFETLAADLAHANERIAQLEEALRAAGRRNAAAAEPAYKPTPPRAPPVWFPLNMPLPCAACGRTIGNGSMAWYSVGIVTHGSPECFAYWSTF